MKRWITPLLLAVTLLLCGAALASTIKLKDGTVLTGEARKLGKSYSIRTADGQTKLIPEGNIESIDGKPVGGDPGASAVSGPVKPSSGGGAFLGVKRKADQAADVAIALTIWEKWIEANASSADLDNAKKELAVWQARQKDNAEKINGKWLGGKELEDFKSKIEKLLTEAIDPNGGEAAVRGVPGVEKLKEVIKLYPENFDANFEMGYYYLIQARQFAGHRQNIDQAIRCLEKASKVRSDIPAVWTNLAIAYNFRQRYEDSVLAAWTAVQADENPKKEIVGNLANALNNAPPNFTVSNARVRSINEQAQVLFKKYGGGGGGNTWWYMRPDPKEVAEGGKTPDAVNKRQGAVWSGSGFLVTPDGYIITNHHVATGDPKTPIEKALIFRVRFDDGTEKVAELIAVDDKADIALMKVTGDKPYPFLEIADANPPQGGDALVLGYPATGERNPTLQISPGSVKSVHDEKEEHAVWFDLNTTHGNSGGPIVDSEARVIAILTAGRTLYNMTITMGVGPLQMQNFLKSLGEKAPTLKYSTASAAPPAFDRVKLTERCKKATLLITVIRGDGTETSTGGEGNKAKGGPPSEGGGTDGAGGAAGPTDQSPPQ